MLGGFLTRVLLMTLGYVYPAFECFKSVEKNRTDIAELRFWCQYWIIVALLTVIERFSDVFISWFPMYGETKLALFLYLWYPKTKGSNYVYSTLLRPYVAKHETQIDRTISELRTRALDLGVFYLQNFVKFGQGKFYQVLNFLAAQSAAAAAANNKNAAQEEVEKETDQQDRELSSPPSSPPSSPRQQHTEKPRLAETQPSTLVNRSSVSAPTKADQGRVQPNSQTAVSRIKNSFVGEAPATTKSQTGDLLNSPKFKLRRLRSDQ